MRLSNYQTETARLLRDRSNILFPLDELTDYINLGRNEVCRITACIRRLITGNSPWGSGAQPGLGVPGAMTAGAFDTSITTFRTLTGVEKYHFDYAKPYLQRQYTGIDSVIDLIEVAVSWGAAARPVMEWWPFEELQALARIYSAGVFTYPFAASLQGDGNQKTLFLFPVPALELEMEWDCSCLPRRLSTDNDYEAIPRPFDEAVKYFAAMYAYLGTQRFGSADVMRQMGLDHLGTDRAASERGQVPSYYV